jgi:murein DD-endopeptidase MepM/ murein hydrolase activator NlpD
MADQSTPKKSGKASLRDTAIRYGGIAGLALSLYVAAHFVNIPQQPAESETESEPSTVQESNSESRVGVKIQRGDTLGAVLKRFGIEPPSAHALIETVQPFVNPKRIRPGDSFQVVLNSEDQSVQAMEFVVDDSLVRVKATQEGWLAEREPIPSVRETQVVRGTIKGSLYQSGTGAGLSSAHIMELAKIFEYDIDFFSDFQSGNAFSVMFEQVRYADGRLGRGRILAAELEAGRDVFNAFYFAGKDGDGYYDGKGEALRRAYLRAPLSYVRISSTFNRNRVHPIFRTVRPHLAIDYAAPQGTPVVAIGRGRVEFIGWRNGYGNMVDIRHANNDISRYAHFSRLPRNLRRGQMVDQGEVIGYVGQTGHATGPHLHFEFIRGGKKINFLDLRIAKTEQLVGEDLQRFHELREERQAMLERTDDRLVENTRTGL